MATPTGEKRHLVIVEIVEAKDLLTMDANGLADPFIVAVPKDHEGKIKFKTEEQRTRVCKETLAPKWNETMTFGTKERLPLRGQIYLKMKDKDIVGHEDMGQVVVPYDFAHRTELNSAKWYTLNKRRAMKEVKGSVRVSIRLVESVVLPTTTSATTQAGEVKKSAAKDVQLYTDRLNGWRAGSGGEEYKWVVRGMNAHEGHEDVQAHALFILAQMFKYTNDARALRTNLTAAGGVQTVIKAMKLYTTNKDVQIGAIVVLSRVALCTDASAIISSQGGVVACLKAMEAYPLTIEVAGRGCALLCYVCLRDIRGREIMIEYGGIKTVLGCLRRWPENGEVAADAANVIAAASWRDTKVQEQIANEGGIDYLFRALDEHKNNSEVNAGVALAFMALAYAHDTNRALINEKDGVRRLIAARDRDLDADNQHTYQTALDVLNKTMVETADTRGESMLRSASFAFASAEVKEWASSGVGDGIHSAPSHHGHHSHTPTSPNLTSINGGGGAVAIVATTTGAAATTASSSPVTQTPSPILSLIPTTA